MTVPLSFAFPITPFPKGSPMLETMTNLKDETVTGLKKIVNQRSALVSASIIEKS